MGGPAALVRRGRAEEGGVLNRSKLALNLGIMDEREQERLWWWIGAVLMGLLVIGTAVFVAMALLEPHSPRLTHKFE